MRSASDVDLVALARRSPTDGWAAIWDAHGASLHGYATRLLGDGADADDVVADAFLVAAERLDQLRDPDALRSWLFAICRRSVQSRWRQRSRTVPVDPHGSTMTTHTTHDAEVTAAGDAAELLQAASSGLGERDRELLALTLGADLDTAAVARIVGEPTAAVSVRVSRLKDTVGRAAGALLLARHHRRDCEELDELLRSWDGSFDTVWRKRIARHVEGCAECERRRGVAVAAFAAPALLPAPGVELRDRVLQRIASRTSPVPSLVEGRAAPTPPWAWVADADGFPVPVSWSQRRRGSWIAAAAVLVLLALAAAVLVGRADRDEAVLAVQASADQTSTTVAADGAVPSVPSVAPPTSPSSGPGTVPALSPADPDGDAAGGLPGGGPEIAGPTGTAPSPPTTLAPPTTVAPPTTLRPPGTIAPTTTIRPTPAPTVSLDVSPQTVETGCGSGVGATASLTIGGDPGVATTVSWDGPDAGQVTVDGRGSFDVRIGPFTQVSSDDGSDDLTVLATVRDAAGRSVSDTAPLEVRITPC